MRLMPLATALQLFTHKKAAKKPLFWSTEINHFAYAAPLAAATCAATSEAKSSTFFSMPSPTT